MVAGRRDQSPLADGLPIEQAERVSSTMEVARERIATGVWTGPTAVLARVQTGGYGRHGRAWHSPEGGVWLTAGWPEDSLGQAGPLPDAGLRVGAACLRVVRGELGDAAERARLKWPNDILIDGRKVCGSICERFESAGRAWLLAGVGINVNNATAELPEGLRRPALALREVTGRAHDVRPLAAALTAQLDAVLRASGGRSLAPEVAARLWKLDEVVELVAGTERMSGVLRGLSDDGRLVIDSNEGRRVAPPGAELV
ncbi:MAG: biotin--[acetyl-CoA-carboxylase] ligase [Planctomycetota bacterium]|nr:biotin--[acetyl-CoA-carboxylase] ligase [Planctomycetota bacterium]